MKTPRIYTRRGDQGTTDLVGGIRISKAHIRLEAYGTIDELSAHMGLLAALLAQNHQDTLAAHIQSIQNSLFNIGTHLATDQEQSTLPAAAQLPASATAQLEQRIDELTAQLPAPAPGFILPGGSVAAAQCHVCRTVCRRAERCIIALAQQATIAPNISAYVNRLSDYLFTLAKIINFNTGHDEILWQNACQ